MTRRTPPQPPPLDPDAVDAMSDSEVERVLQQSQLVGAAAIRQALLDAPTFQKIDEECAALNKSDVGNAERLALRAPDRIMFVEGVGWHGWDGTHWNFARGRVIAHNVAIDVHKGILAEARSVYERGPVLHETPAQFEKRVSAHISWYTATGNATRLRNMVDTASAKVTRMPDELDADDELFCCANGTLHLKDISAVKLRRSNPAHLMTRLSPVRFDPKATCPKFQAFMQDVLPDVEVRGFVQRWCGYLMSGKTTNQCLSLWWGKGANGKSKIIKTFSAVVGDGYAYTTSDGFAGSNGSFTRSANRRRALTSGSSSTEPN
jgi:putative DNA primase/helicase